MYDADIEKVARESRPILDLLMRELAVGKLSEPITGSIHPQVFVSDETVDNTRYRVAYALGLSNSESIAHIARLGQDEGVNDEAANRLACKVRSAITGELVEDLLGVLLSDRAPYQFPAGVALTDAQAARLDEVNDRLRKTQERSDAILGMAEKVEKGEMSKEEATAAVNELLGKTSSSEEPESNEVPPLPSPKLEDSLRGGVEVPPKPLPDDFPGREELAAAGITTYAEAHKVSDSGTLTDIKGIGPATADKIQAALLPKRIK